MQGIVGERYTGKHLKDPGLRSLRTDGEKKEKKLPSNPTLIFKMRLLNFWVLQDIKTLLLNFSHQSQKKKKSSTKTRTVIKIYFWEITDPSFSFPSSPSNYRQTTNHNFGFRTWSPAAILFLRYFVPTGFQSALKRWASTPGLL